MAMTRAAADVLIPGSSNKTTAKRPAEMKAQSETSPSEIAQLREQMAMMQKKLDELGK